tara:strand:- start:36324 stop:37868 length:1545 start_codon:yes stop_codon:yes gene_type:complete
MKRPVLPLITFFILFITLTGSVQIDQPETPLSIGVFKNSLDMGEVSHSGSAHYDSENQTYTISGSGSGVGESDDAFQFLWNSVQGDFILRAEVHHQNPSENVNSDIVYGWSVRNSLGSDSEMMTVSVSPTSGASASVRAEKGSTASSYTLLRSFIDVIQLERVNGVYTVRFGVFGEPLKVQEMPEINLRNEVLAGLFVHSNDPDEVAEVSFRNVRIVKPFPENEQRYQRYLGSRMEVLEVETGLRKVLFESEHSVQAPNWTVDNEKLIYNSNGYLYNYELSTGQITYLNTGFAIRNNNDHVITFDGEQIAISHHVASDNNQSTIFMLPIEGSDNPRQVSKSGVGHSYLHGVSPDNQTVIFTGWRNNKYDLYAADVNTMEETQLTDTPFLDDGSEYSPDGEYIYFNSNRTGAMQLWRMKPDGSEQTQLTFDENFNDWFPHISPDGEKILFISYGTDVESGDHPFYKHVTLRVMPVSGGEPTIVAYLYGGQGTINVPSWSPDSRYVAFVSNSGRFY